MLGQARLLRVFKPNVAVTIGVSGVTELLNLKLHLNKKWFETPRFDAVCSFSIYANVRVPCIGMMSSVVDHFYHALQIGEPSCKTVSNLF